MKLDKLAKLHVYQNNQYRYSITVQYVNDFDSSHEYIVYESYMYSEINGNKTSIAEQENLLTV